MSSGLWLWKVECSDQDRTGLGKEGARKHNLINRWGKCDCCSLRQRCASTTSWWRNTALSEKPWGRERGRGHLAAQAFKPAWSKTAEHAFCIRFCSVIWCTPPGSLKRRYHYCHSLQMRTPRLRDRGNMSQSHLGSKQWHLLYDFTTCLSHCLLNSVWIIVFLEASLWGGRT